MRGYTESFTNQRDNQPKKMWDMSNLGGMLSTTLSEIPLPVLPSLTKRPKNPLTGPINVCGVEGRQSALSIELHHLNNLALHHPAMPTGQSPAPIHQGCKLGGTSIIELHSCNFISPGFLHGCLRSSSVP